MTPKRLTRKRVEELLSTNEATVFPSRVVTDLCRALLAADEALAASPHVSACRIWEPGAPVCTCPHRAARLSEDEGE